MHYVHVGTFNIWLSFLITGLLIVAGSLFAWASGAGERRYQVNDTEKTIPSQENKCSLLIQEHVLENNDENSMETKQRNGDQEIESYDNEQSNIEVSEMENLRKATQLEIHSLFWNTHHSCKTNFDALNAHFDK